MDRLSGRFRTGSDMGIDGTDVALMARVTPWATHKGLPPHRVADGMVEEKLAAARAARGQAGAA